MRPREQSRSAEDAADQIRAAGVSVVIECDDGFGMQPQDAEDDSVPIYPESADALALFAALITQWRMGPGGPTGIDHARRDAEARRLFAGPRRRRRACELLAVMESEALRIITEQARAALEH